MASVTGTFITQKKFHYDKPGITYSISKRIQNRPSIWGDFKP